jgi:hypothetical protein
MQLWHWLLLLGLVFLITYNPRTGNITKYFGSEISERRHDDAQRPPREAQSDSDSSEHGE